MRLIQNTYLYYPGNKVYQTIADFLEYGNPRDDFGDEMPCDNFLYAKVKGEYVQIK